MADSITWQIKKCMIYDQNSVRDTGLEIFIVFALELGWPASFLPEGNLSPR